MARRTSVTDDAGAMMITSAQIFLGALTIGIALFRGNETSLAFHRETVMGHANYAASVLARDHARAANAIATNNTISAAIMGPRLAVEADYITMQENAKVACPQKDNPYMQYVCNKYKSGRPRAQTKLSWVRSNQENVWRSLGQLSSELDKVASLRAEERIGLEIRADDSGVRMRIDDPSRTSTIWGASGVSTAVSLAEKDAANSTMPGHAFPLLMPNLHQGLPMALVHRLASAFGGQSQGRQDAQLAEVPSVNQSRTEDCRRLEESMQCAIARARGGSAGVYCSDDFSADVGPVSNSSSSRVSLPGEVEAFTRCESAARGGGARRTNGPAYTYTANGQTIVCSFQRERCMDDRLRKRSKEYLDDLGVNVAAAVGGTASSAAGGTASGPRAPSDSRWNRSTSFRACVYASRPVGASVVKISRALKKIVSFGASSSSDALTGTHEYAACGRWYFPDGQGSRFSEVPHERQPFVAGWTHAMTTEP